jgi:hypothetical protein
MAKRTPLQNLDDLNLMISIYVYHAICSSLVTNYVQNIFYHNKEQYRTNTANNLIYAGQKALEEQSIVHMVELIKGSDRDLPAGLQIKHKTDLICHRDYLSHPYMQKYFPRMEKFIEDRRQYFDFRPMLIWQMQGSINEVLVDNGLTARNTSDDIKIRYDMALMVDSILKLSVKSEVQSSIPSTQDIVKALDRFKAEYIHYISVNNGVRPRPKEKKGK